MLGQVQAVNEQLMRLEGEVSMANIEDWKEPLEKKASLENAAKVAVQDNIILRAVSICMLSV